MRIDCVFSNVCQMWARQIVDNGGCYTHSCRNCPNFLERRELVKSITGYTQTVKKFLEGE